MNYNIVIVASHHPTCNNNLLELWGAVGYVWENTSFVVLHKDTVSVEPQLGDVDMSLWPHLDTSLRWVVVVLLLLLIMRTFVSDDRDTQRNRAWGWHDPDGNGLSTTITTRRRLNGSFKGSGTTTRYSRNH